MADTIKITDLMAEALGAAVPLGDEWEVPLTSGGSAGTLKGLQSRGLVEVRQIANGEIPGYTGRYPNVRNNHTVLTPRGEAVRASLLSSPDTRSWSVGRLDAINRTSCGETNPGNPGQTCKRERGHVGDHRPTFSYVSSQTHWSTPVVSGTIKITGRMADALINTAVSEDERTVRLSLNVLVGTVVALMDRGFVEHNQEMSQKNGYPTHTFTPLGMAAQEQLVKENWGPNPKTFSREKLMAAAAGMSQPAATEPVRYCGEPETQTGYDYTCTLSGPHNTHKAQGLSDQVLYEWPAVTEYSVKIWYRSGAYEGVTHSPEDLARKIYADAAASAGVEFAELHGPSGKLVESRGPSDDRDVSPQDPAEPPLCGRVFTEDSSSVCVRTRGHYGLHRDKINASSSLAVSWGDNECRTA